MGRFLSASEPPAPYSELKPERFDDGDIGRDWTDETGTDRRAIDETHTLKALPLERRREATVGFAHLKGRRA